MDKELKRLIEKYEYLLRGGEKFVSEMNPGHKCERQAQLAVNNIWKIILKDLYLLTDKLKYDH